MEARRVEKECSEVGFGLAGDPRGDHSCLSNLIEGLDGVTRRGLGSKSGKSEQRQMGAADRRQYEYSGDIRRTWRVLREGVEVGRERE